MALQSFDKLNNTNRKSVPFNEYFGEMGLPKEEIYKRIDMAMAFYDLLMVLFLLYKEQVNADAINEVALKSVLTEGYYDILAEQDKIDDDYLQDMANDQIDDIVNSTIEHEGDDYYISEDRAIFVAEDQANNVCNYMYYDDIVKSGKYTKKTWKTVLDDRVRDNHMAVDGVTIPIDDVFSVGTSEMRFPKDTELGASPQDLINCRCYITFS